jgi:hypothetical protein
VLQLHIAIIIGNAILLQLTPSLLIVVVGIMRESIRILNIDIESVCGVGKKR